MKPAYHPIYPTPKIEDRDREGEFVKFEGKEQTHLSEKQHNHIEARSKVTPAQDHFEHQSGH